MHLAEFFNLIAFVVFVFVFVFCILLFVFVFVMGKRNCGRDGNGGWLLGAISVKWSTISDHWETSPGSATFF